MLESLGYRMRRLQRSALARMALFAPGVGGLGARPNPLLRLEYPCPRRNRTLLVFLPGIDDLAEDFERHGFIDELRRQAVAADAVALDLHFGYYRTRALFERLTEDVIDAAHAVGYREIWLVGISLGGFGAVSYAARHDAHVSGIVLLAPYLGQRPLIDEISGAGGLSDWAPGQPGLHDHERLAWSWLKRQTGREDGVRIHLGYGEGDKFARANALLGRALPPGHALAIPGRHDWPTWKRLWRQLVADWRQDQSERAR